MAIELSWPTIKQSAVCIGKNATCNIGSASYNWAPTERQIFFWRLNTQYTTALHCTAPKSSFTQSVFSIYPCIQLHKYECNVSQFWFFYCCLSCQYFRTSSLCYYNITFCSLGSRITQRSNPDCYFGLKIFDHLIARGYYLFQNWICLYSWFEWPYFTNHIGCLVGFNECRLELSYSLE